MHGTRGRLGRDGICEHASATLGTVPTSVPQSSMEKPQGLGKSTRHLHTDRPAFPEQFLEPFLRNNGPRSPKSAKSALEKVSHKGFGRPPEPRRGAPAPTPATPTHTGLGWGEAFINTAKI